VAEDLRELRVNPQYAVFHIEKNDALRRLFKQLIELRLVCSQLLAASLEGRLYTFALGEVRNRSHELKAAVLVLRGSGHDAQVFDGSIRHEQPMFKIELRPLA